MFVFCSIAKKEIRERMQEINMTFDGQLIKFKKEIELFGIPVRKDLSIAPFIEKKAKKCMKRIGM